MVGVGRATAANEGTVPGAPDAWMARARSDRLASVIVCSKMSAMAAVAG